MDFHHTDFCQDGLTDYPGYICRGKNGHKTAHEFVPYDHQEGILDTDPVIVVHSSSYVVPYHSREDLYVINPDAIPTGHDFDKSSTCQIGFNDLLSHVCYRQRGHLDSHRMVPFKQFILNDYQNGIERAIDDPSALRMEDRKDLEAVGKKPPRQFDMKFTCKEGDSRYHGWICINPGMNHLADHQFIAPDVFLGKNGAAEPCPEIVSRSADTIVAFADREDLDIVTKIDIRENVRSFNDGNTCQVGLNSYQGLVCLKDRCHTDSHLFTTFARFKQGDSTDAVEVSARAKELIPVEWREDLEILKYEVRPKRNFNSVKMCRVGLVDHPGFVCIEPQRHKGSHRFVPYQKFVDAEQFDAINVEQDSEVLIAFVDRTDLDLVDCDSLRCTKAEEISQIKRKNELETREKSRVELRLAEFKKPTPIVDNQSKWARDIHRLLTCGYGLSYDPDQLCVHGRGHSGSHRFVPVETYLDGKCQNATTVSRDDASIVSPRKRIHLPVMHRSDVHERSRDLVVKYYKKFVIQRVQESNNDSTANTHCPTPLKSAYHTKKAALRGAVTVATGSRGKTGKSCIYHCKCGKFHITSKG